MPEPYPNPKSALEAVLLIANRAEAMLLACRREFERAPWHDAEPNGNPIAVTRVAVMGALLEQAEEAARVVRLELGVIVGRMDRR